MTELRSYVPLTRIKEAKYLTLSPSRGKIACSYEHNQCLLPLDLAPIPSDAPTLAH